MWKDVETISSEISGIKNVFSVSLRSRKGLDGKSFIRDEGATLSVGDLGSLLLIPFRNIYWEIVGFPPQIS